MLIPRCDDCMSEVIKDFLETETPNQSLVNALEQRRQMGISKYGHTFSTHQGHNMVQDTFEELADAACYWKGVLIVNPMNYVIADVYTKILDALVNVFHLLTQTNINETGQIEHGEIHQGEQVTRSSAESGEATEP